MKKLVSLVLVLILLTAALTGCAKPATNTPETPKGETPAAETPAEGGKVAKLGLGQNISIAKSKDAGVDANGKEILAVAQADVTIAAVGFDKDGKVASISIDVAQSKVEFDNELKVASDKAAEVPSKVELGADYGMGKVSSIQKEWHEQIAGLEDWMLGKTVDEIKGLNLNEGRPDVPELTSAVTITVGAYIEAVEEAWNNAVDAEGAETVGLGIKTSIAKSKDAGVDANGKEILPVGQFDTYMTATAFDKDGKVVASIIDTAQVKVEFDSEGKVTSDLAAAPKTKNELKEEYGMGKVSSIQKEWYEQAAELGKWMVGKTLDEIKGINLNEGRPDVPELASAVTITVGDYIEIVEEALSNTK